MIRSDARISPRLVRSGDGMIARRSRELAHNASRANIRGRSIRRLRAEPLRRVAVSSQAAARYRDSHGAGMTGIDPLRSRGNRYKSLWSTTLSGRSVGSIHDLHHCFGIAQ